MGKRKLQHLHWIESRRTMRIIKASLLMSLLILCFASCSKKQPGFKYEAKLITQDGLSIELADFQLIGGRSFYPEGSYESKPPEDREMTGLPLRISQATWRELPISEISSLVLEPIQDQLYWKWFNTKIRTKAGEEISGRIPVDPDFTWHCAAWFLIRGRSNMSGGGADLKIPFKELRKIEAKGESTYILTDEKGNNLEVQEPKFCGRWDPPLRRIRADWNLARAGIPSVKVKVGDTEKWITLAATKRLWIERIDGRGPQSFHLETRDGKETSGVMTDGLRYLFGRTKDNRIWFLPLDPGFKIEFATPPRKWKVG